MTGNIIKSSRLVVAAYLGLCILGLVFYGVKLTTPTVSVFAISRSSPIISSVGIAFFTTGCVVFASCLISQWPVYLLDDRGFTVRFAQRSMRVEWDEIDRFEVRGSKSLALVWYYLRRNPAGAKNLFKPIGIPSSVFVAALERRRHERSGVE